MKATLTRPLPLELTQPVELGTSLEAALKVGYAATATKYNPATQVRENPEGIPQFVDHGGSESEQESESCSGFLVIDVTVDIQVDDL